MRSGIEELWKSLENSEPHLVCERAGAAYSREKQQYSLTCFGETVYLCLTDRSIQTTSGVGRLLLERFEEDFCLSLLAYMVYVQGREITGELVRPTDLPGGQIYREGAHQLPLAELAAYYREESSSFLESSDRLGGVRLDYGDASCRLYPFPKLPVTLILRERDEEFPERADLYFDAGSRDQFPPDVLWSVASLSVALLIRLCEQAPPRDEP